MKQFFIRALSSLLAFGIVLCAAPAVSAASGDFSFDTENGKAAVTGYAGAVENGVFTVSDLDSDTGTPLTAVADRAFAFGGGRGKRAYLAAVTRLIVEAGVSEIGERAFADLPALQSVVFEGEVTVKKGAFANCEALRSVAFNNGARLENGAFRGCAALSELNVPAGKPFEAPAGALRDTAWFTSFPGDFVAVNGLLLAYKGAAQEAALPQGVERIGAGAFAGNKTLAKVTLPAGVKEIGENAFSGCAALRDIVFSAAGKLEAVGRNAFRGTPYLKSLPVRFFILDDILVKYKGKTAENVVLPNTLRAVAPGAFEGAAEVASVTVPAGLAVFGENCFALASGENGRPVLPELRAYTGTPAFEALAAAGYRVSALPLPVPPDVDGDGGVTAEDARRALRLAVELDTADETAMRAADADADGMVTAEDARRILRIAVGLDDFVSSEELFAPNTAEEILSVYTAAVKKAARLQTGFSKAVSGAITGADVNRQHKNRVLEIAKQGLANRVRAYAPGPAAAAQLIAPPPFAAAHVKEADLTAEKGKYLITISFSDATDALITAETPAYTPAGAWVCENLPAVKGSVFYDYAAAQKWFRVVPENDARTLNCVRKYAMEYVSPEITAVIDMKTGLPEQIVTSVTYRFTVNGAVNGVDITTANFGGGPAVVERTDSVSYSDFHR